VTIATGIGFPPNTPISLRWSAGITATPLEPTVSDATGAFSAQVLVLPRDRVGLRTLRAVASVPGLDVDPVGARFLVVTSTAAPPASSRSSRRHRANRSSCAADPAVDSAPTRRPAGAALLTRARRRIVPGRARVGYDRPDMTICAKCGTENAASDAFCGSCGAFLEFAAEEVAEASAGGVAAEASDHDVAGGTQAGVPPPSPATVPAPTPGTPGEAEVEAGSTGPTCAACGRVNPAGRRFCISCGERLPSTTAAVAPAPAAAASAASTLVGPPGPPPAPGPAKPAWEFPAVPVASASGPAAPDAPVAKAPATGGRSRLPLIGGAIVILALLGGAVLVLGGGLGSGTPGPTASASSPGALASPSPDGAATSEPSAAAETPAPETPAPSEAPSLPPEPEPTVPLATMPPGSPVGIAIVAAKASSQLAPNRAPTYLYDGSPVTAWKSKTGKLDGSWVEVAFPATAVTKIQLWPGWQRDEPLFYGNHRPHNVTVAFDGGVPVPLELEDALGAQGVAIPPELGIVGATRLRITIIDTYPSRKTSAGGSPSKEVAVSEIRVFGIPVAP
jgi:hypothetical protein